MQLKLTLDGTEQTVDFNHGPLFVSAGTTELVTQVLKQLERAAYGTLPHWERIRVDDYDDLTVILSANPEHYWWNGPIYEDCDSQVFCIDLDVLDDPESREVFDAFNAIASQVEVSVILATTQAPKYLPDLSGGKPQQVLYYADDTWQLDRF